MPLPLTRTSLLAMTGLSLAGALLVLSATVHGIGVSPDSVAYIGAARNLLDGRGLSLPYGHPTDIPLTHYPPLYPLLLAGSGLFGADPADGARWINALAFALSIFSVGLLVAQVTGRALLPPILGSLVATSAAPLVAIYTMAWSEALFLPLLLLTLRWLARCLRRPGTRDTVIAGMLTGLAISTRYAGVSLAATGFIGILALQNGPVRQRMVDALRYSLSALVLPVVWLTHNAVGAASMTGRTAVFHPVDLEKVRDAVTTLSSWVFVPVASRGTVKLAVLSILALCAAYLIGRPSPDRAGDDSDRVPLVRVIGLFMCVYGAFLALSLSFFDANTPLDDRILAPLLIAGVVVAFYALDEVARRMPRKRPWEIGLAAVVLVFASLNLLEASANVRAARGTGVGFSSAYWRNAEILTRVDRLPADVLIYTNSPGGVYYLTGRRALPVPQRADTVTGRANDRFVSDVAEMRSSIESGRGVVLYLTPLGRGSAPREQELQGLMPLVLIARTEHATLLARGPLLTGQ